jgi:hypothetical protein
MRIKVKKLFGLAAIRNAILLWRASKMYLKAVDEAERKYRKDKLRYFVIWDPTRRSLIPLTYELHNEEGGRRAYMRKHPMSSYRDYLYSCRSDSYKSLVLRGRFKNRLDYNEFKSAAFYYTPSRKSEERCHGDDLEQRKQEWMKFYTKVSRCNTFSHSRLNFSPKRFAKSISLTVKSIVDYVINLFY